jgi:methylglutaconyl-CoA hydratase
VIDTGDGENRLSPNMLDRLASTLETPPEGTHVLHLAARGPAFCLGPRPPVGGMPPRDLLSLLIRFNRALRDSHLVTVAEIDGTAAGFGVGVAALADLTFAGDAASLRLPEVENDVLPALVLSWLTETVGIKAAAAMALTARALGPTEAAAVGLVTEACPTGELRRRVDDAVSNLAGMSPATVAEIKRYLRDRRSLDVRDAEELALERSVAWLERP